MENVKKVPEYEILPGLKEGSKSKGIIVDIQDGISRDFVKNAETWKGDLDAPAYNVQFKSNETGRIGEQILTHPGKGEKLSDRANLAKYKDENGDFPFVGQKVTLIVKDGWERLKM